MTEVSSTSDGTMGAMFIVRVVRIALELSSTPLRKKLDPCWYLVLAGRIAATITGITEEDVGEAESPRRRVSDGPSRTFKWARTRRVVQCTF